jgi:hypothetical protein
LARFPRWPPRERFCSCDGRSQCRTLPPRAQALVSEFQMTRRTPFFTLPSGHHRSSETNAGSGTRIRAPSPVDGCNTAIFRD